MQVLNYANDKSISSWQDDSGSYIRGFLISTKLNKNNWKVTKDTIDKHAKQFIGKDFVVIPDRIGISALWDGHDRGHRDKVLNTYSQNSYGKIQNVLGPFEYGDGDIWYEHISKLTNNKVASAFMQHGAGTLIPFATSADIWPIEGDDLNGWNEWEPLGVVLCSNPAYGQQSVITKTCTGQETKCTNALTEENKIAAVVNLVSSLVNSDTSKGISMETKDTLQVSEDMNKAANNVLANDSLQVQETNSKQPVQEQKTIITDEIKPTQSQSQQETSDEVKILRQKIAEMENEKKEEILNSMFSVLTDEKEKDRLIKEISKGNDLNTIKYLKGWVDILAPLHRKAGESEATKAFKAEQEKELATFKKNKIASANYKFQLPGEPKEPEQTDENKVASTQKIGEIASLQALLKGVSN